MKAAAPPGRPAKTLLAASAACVVLGDAAIVAAWRNPDSDLATVLATASGWPWLLAALQGGLVWARRRQRSADPFEHFLAVYAAGTAWAALAATAALALADDLSPLPEWLPPPLEPLAAALTAMAVAAVLAGATLGLVFPALLPPAAAALSAWLLGARPPSRARLAAGTAGTALAWLAAAFAGLALAHA